MQMQPNYLAQSQKTEHCVSLRGLLNARHLIAVEASGPGYFPYAPLASCLANRCADLLGGHAKRITPLAMTTSLRRSHIFTVAARRIETIVESTAPSLSLMANSRRLVIFGVAFMACCCSLMVQI